MEQLLALIGAFSFPVKLYSILKQNFSQIKFLGLIVHIYQDFKKFS